jgi:hypothetical protein
LHWPCLLQFVVLQVLSAADRTCGAGCLWRGTHKTWRKQQRNPGLCLACQAPSIMHPEWPPLHRQPHSLVYVAFTCGYQPLLCCKLALPQRSRFRCCSCRFSACLRACLALPLLLLCRGPKQWHTAAVAQRGINPEQARKLYCGGECTVDALRTGFCLIDQPRGVCVCLVGQY